MEQSAHNILCFALLLGGVINVCDSQSSIGSLKINDPYKITRIIFDPARSRLRPGHVFGGRECGGTGRLLEIRHNSCKSSGFLCSFVAGRLDDAHIVFIPNENMKDLVVRATVITTDGKTVTGDVSVPGANLVGGQTYHLTTSTIFASEMRGQTFTSRLEIFSQGNYRARTCVEGDGIVV